MDIQAKISERKLAIVGLGYVGLPLAVAFAKHRPVMGFDIDSIRISDIASYHDRTLELSQSELKEASHLSVTSTLKDIAFCDVFIVTVPTPIDEQKQPDFSHVIAASRAVGSILKPGDVVVYESTMYPGAVEEICVPVLQKTSNLVYNTDFFVGYSPERINPGDRLRRIENIKKITSGSTAEMATLIDGLYREIIIAGTHKASSIKVAEAAKVIENTQRDLNIALINELAIIFNRLNIDTEEVLLAAETKWNFLSFRPGLVGGHCIGVDPYYLTHKAQMVGYHPEIILAGRRLNDNMGVYVVSQLIKKMIHRQIQVDGATVLVMGLTFKENCPDVRNTRVIDVVQELKSYNMLVDVCDPWVNEAEVEEEYGLTLCNNPSLNHYDAIIVAVGHDEFKAMDGASLRSFGKTKHVLYDLKYILPKECSDLRL